MKRFLILVAVLLLFAVPAVTENAEDILTNDNWVFMGVTLTLKKDGSMQLWNHIIKQ